jgi:hypothetical protein
MNIEKPGLRAGFFFACSQFVTISQHLFREFALTILPG